MSKYFLVTIYTCENTMFLENIMRVTHSYVSKDMVMSVLAEENVPKELMPLYYTAKELNFNGMIQAHELKRLRFELEQERKERE